MAAHLRESELVRWVSGELHGAEADALEQHIAVCATCANRLSEEAWVETAMAELGCHVAQRRSAQRRGRWAAARSCAVAASLAIGLGLFMQFPRESHGLADMQTMPGASDVGVLGSFPGAHRREASAELAMSFDVWPRATAPMSLPEGDDESADGGVCEVAQDDADLTCGGWDTVEG